MSNIIDLLTIMAKLRDPETGCPWDREQSFATIAPYTLEEAYEVADAIARGDMAELKEELGDLLLQVVFHTQMAREAGHFEFADVVAGITDKLIRRHPHVFGNEQIASAEAQTTAWEAHKARERQSKSLGITGVMDGVSLALPALTRSVKLQKRAARVGFDWQQVESVIAKVEEELQEVKEALAAPEHAEHLQDEIGDLLASCANLARFTGIDPEAALRRANAKFERRFRHIETALAEQGQDIANATLEEMDALWEAAKRQERKDLK